jgi:predicted DNA binding protein
VAAPAGHSLDLAELANAAAFVRGDRPRWHFQRPLRRSRADFTEDVQREDALRTELLARTEPYDALFALTPHQLSVLLCYAAEGSIARVAERFSISRQTVKNHLVAMHKTIYGADYRPRASTVPLVALAVRWAIDADPRDLAAASHISTH